MNEIRYEYTAASPNGQPSSGFVEAMGEQDAYRRLAARGLTPLKLKECRVRAPLFSFNKIGSDDVAGFTRELGVLLEAKIPLARGLASIAEHNDKAAMRVLVRKIAVAVEAGMPLTQAFSEHPETFNEVYIETIRAAERSGNLSGVVTHLADLLERQAETRQMLRRALTYPIIVLAVIAMAISIIFLFVVPRFASTFESQNIKLPLVTVIVQSVAASFKGHWYAYLGTLVGAAMLLTTMWRSERGRPRLELILTRLPYVGKLVLSNTVSRFCGIMTIGLNSGLDVIESMEMSGRATGTHAFERQTRVMAERLRRGEQLGDVLTGSRYIPSFARRMIAAGKDAKELGRACEIVARHYERQSSHLMKNVNTVIEPLLTVALASIVLVIALSVFLPMWEMLKVRR